MQSLINRYAALITNALKGGASKDFATKLIAYMKAHGHVSLLPAILRRVERTARSADSAVVTLAHASDAKTLAPKIAGALSTLGVEGDYALSVDENIVGGYSVVARHKVIDQTYRKALVDLYQRITN